MSQEQVDLLKEFEALRAQFDNAEKEIKSLTGGRKASSARARKSLQAIKSQSHQMRKSCVSHTKSMPTKSRAKKEKPVEPVPDPEPEPVVEEKEVEKPKPKRKPRASKKAAADCS